MKISSAIAVATMAAAASFAGTASAQKASVTPAQMYFNDAWEIAAPAEGTTATLKLDGLKTAHVAFVTFTKFVGAAPTPEGPVITVMEGAMVKWAGGKESCVYEFRLIASPPAVTIVKTPGMCVLKQPGNQVFRVLAM